jgi:hypothetical protein
LFRQVNAADGKTRARATGMGQQKALVIGVSSYPLPIPSLPGVANDAQAMADILGSPQGQFRPSGVEVLTDASANAGAIRDRLAVALKNAARDDTVFVYIAGHGEVHNGVYYFVAHDTVPARLAETGVPLTELRDLFDGSPSRRIFVWLDFCHSGGIIDRSASGSVDEENEIIERTLKVAKGAGKLIVAACTAEQTAKEPRHGTVRHGFFTLALIDGLRGKAANADGEVTASSLYEYVVKRVEAESRDQCPVMIGHMQGSIVLMHYADRVLPQDAVATTSVVPAACDSSGDWILLHTNFLHADEVRHNADGTITAEIASRSTEESAAIQQLHPSRHDRPRSVAFAYGDDALIVSVSKIEGRSSGKRQVWTVTLKPEDIRYGGGLMEMSVQGHSADEIAEMRTGRLLLNDPAPPRQDARRRNHFDIVENAIRGMGTRIPVERCILHGVWEAYGTQPTIVLPYARLSSIYILKASDCVEQVLELRLGPVTDGKCHVRFRGRRARRASNVEPHVISLEGDCPLEGIV